MNVQDRQLVMDAAQIALICNDGNVERGGADFWNGGVHYKDDVVEIYYNPKNGAMEIERIANRNPVVCLAPVENNGEVMMFGRCIRTHGESQELYAHVGNFRYALMGV